MTVIHRRASPRVKAFRPASGSIRNARRGKTPIYGFTTSKVTARKAAAKATGTGNTKYGTRKGYLIIPK